jgi:hypothetical protein
MTKVRTSLPCASYSKTFDGELSLPVTSSKVPTKT